MKLNLLPTSVATADRSKFAMVIGAVIALLGVALALLLIFASRASVTSAKNEAEEQQPRAAAALRRSQEAEAVIATVTNIERNLRLAEAMIDHNYEYPTLYRTVLSYIPTFFRVTSISAVPLGQDSAAVTVTGMIDTRQDFADMAIAMLRVPGALTLSRSGFTGTTKIVPALNENDQTGRMIEPGEANIPSDPLERIDALVARAMAAPTGFENVGNFGSPDTEQRGTMPEWSLVTFTIVVQGEEYGILAPDPRATLEADLGAAGANAAAGASPFPTPGAAPGGGG